MIDPSLNSKFFKGNRDKLFRNLAVDAVVISANGLMQKTADQAFPFRQDSNFWYLTGTDEPDLILVITKSEEFFIVPDFYTRRQSAVETIDRRSLSSISGIAEIMGEKDGLLKLDSVLKEAAKLATTYPSQALLKFHGIYSNPARRKLLTSLRRRYPQMAISDARTELARQRMVKQPVEINLIKRATDITTETLKEALSASVLGSYKDTSDIEQAISSGFIKRGGSGHAFDPVVAAGKNATLIHYGKLSQRLVNNELIVCDVGSQYSHYGGDITRTVSYGQPTSRQQEVYKAVSYVQATAFKYIKPGIDFKEYEKHVQELVGQQLRQLGVIKRISRKAVRQYFPHFCSHSLGLDTHDSADYSQPLPENMVMAVEPGIYLPEEGIGVRIEDTVRITKDGCEIISANLPASLKL